MNNNSYESIFLQIITKVRIESITLIIAGKKGGMTDMEEKTTHEELVQKVLDNQPDDEYLYDLSELFKIFGDSTRIKILYAMFDTELNVGDMARILNLSQSSVSHQLRILKDAKLVKFRREGKSIYYSLDDEHVRMILSLGMEHVEE